MSIRLINGNIFTSKCQTLVNTVNCVGVMGAGIALECRLRYPDMYQKYIQLCHSNQIDIGMLWIYKSLDRWILNFPTKKHWKYPSKTEYLHAGLNKFVKTYQEKGIISVAFPLLGSDKGGIAPSESLDIMMSYLEKPSIDVEIYKYDKKSKDDLYEKTKEYILSKDIKIISESTKLKKNYVAKVITAMQSPDIVQLNQLAGIRGIGVKTLEKIFQFSQKMELTNTNNNFVQETLF